MGSFQMAVLLGSVQCSRTRRPLALETNATVVGDSWTTRHFTAPAAVRSVVVPVTRNVARWTVTPGARKTSKADQTLWSDERSTDQPARVESLPKT
ncbi:MAG TPA: hypothetical protein VFW04_14555 [Gemmatimonadaceae bacterium]|nr:hypothetical protein [Gemmatimonadaceae bacterium]